MITTVFTNLDLTAAFKDPDNYPYIISNDATGNSVSTIGMHIAGEIMRCSDRNADGIYHVIL